jgi:hypothetical protein
MSKYMYEVHYLDNREGSSRVMEVEAEDIGEAFQKAFDAWV